jgi:enoyl-CoA hydratase/carnithine racemase
VIEPYERLVVERRGPVGWIINDRPDVLNAYDDTMRAEFRRAYRQLEDDPSVCVLVHAAHGRAFQVGVDIAAFSDEQGTDRFEREVREFDLGLTGWHIGVTKPVIVAVNGVCAGDIVIAASDATFVDPHVSMGQVTAFEVIGMARRAPFEAVMRMALVGSHERMSAQRAYELGLVSEVIDPPGELHAAAQALAERIAEADPHELAGRKAALWAAQEAWRVRAEAVR